MIRFGYGLLLLGSLGILGCGAEAQKTSKPGEAVKLPSGLQYEEITVGTGPEAAKGKVIDCYYTGWLKNGTKFATNVGEGQPMSIRLGAGEVIKGWEDGIPGMKEGGKRKLLIPADMAYGPAGKGPIPPFSDLIFEIEIVKVK
jgi:FKBP-type peptidyl-prolyl cis-trans isomerase